jgi:ParB family chromosome partitioning protein
MSLTPSPLANRPRKRARIQTLKVDLLSPSTSQPRSVFEEQGLAELAASVSLHGVLQPLLIQKSLRGYEIIAGERRWRAAKLAGLKEVPCIEVDLGAADAMVVALVENIQREDLNPLEEAHAYLRLQNSLTWSQEEIAQRVGKDRTTITNALRLLRLPLEVQNLLSNQVISTGHARALLALKNADMIVMVANKISRDGLSVRAVESLVRSLAKGKSLAKIASLNGDDQQHEALLKEIRSKLEYFFGNKVSIVKNRGSFSISITCSSTVEFNDLLDRCGIKI